MQKETLTPKDIDIIQCERSPAARRIPTSHCLLGLDRQSGQAFGNATRKGSVVILCAYFDGVRTIQTRKAVLFPLTWLHSQYPQEDTLWKAQCQALRRYARKNNLPFAEPF